MKAIDIIKNKLSKILDGASNAPSPTIPSIAILGSARREGLSAIKTTYNILQRKKELGLPVGDYEDGSPNENDLLIYAIVSEVFKALQEDAKISVAIAPGTQLLATGANAGGPIEVFGATQGIGSGGAVIQ